MNDKDIYFLFKGNQEKRIFLRNFFSGINVKKWDSWKRINDCTVNELNEANLRELLDNEIILDLEQPKQLGNVLSWLDANNFSYDVWHSGSRGYHIHLTFPELKNYSENERKIIRSWFIKETDTDISKISGLITIENRPSFKTNKIKQLIKSVDNGINNIPTEAKKLLNQQRIINIPSREEQVKIKHCMLIDYSLKNKIKANCGRGNVLAKNAAIYFLNNFEKENAKMLFYDLISFQKTGDQSWLTWADKERKTDFSCRELRNWLRTAGLYNIEEVTCWRCPYGKSKRSI